MTYQKLTTENLESIIKHFELEDDSYHLLEDKESIPESIECLIENNQLIDATKLLAHALPVREAVWWACVCSRYHEDSEEADDCYVDSLKAAEKWVYEPSEKNRRIAEYFAEKGKYESAAAWTAAAAFWSGGSITKEGEPKVEPGKNLYSHAVSGAIIMSAGMVKDKSQVNDEFNLYLQHGLNIAQGKNG